MTRRTWVLILIFVASIPAVTLRLYASDEIEYFSYLRSLWFDHDLSFDNEYRYFYDHAIARGPGFRETFLELTTPTGLRYNFGTVGCALLWAPMYAVADAGVRVARLMGSPVEADGFSRPYIAAVAYGSALYGFLAVLLSAFVARRLVGREQGEVFSAWASAVVWFGTPLPFYMYLAPGMAHACSAFAVAAFVAAWLSVRERWTTRGLVALGALAALMTMVREQDAFFAIGVVVDFAWTLADDVRSGRRALAFRPPEGGACRGRDVCPVFPSSGVGVRRVERPARSSQRRRPTRCGGIRRTRLQVLFSPEHGLFLWTPLALVCVVGTIRRWRRRPTPPHRALSSADVSRTGVHFGERRYLDRRRLVRPAALSGGVGRVDHGLAAWFQYPGAGEIRRSSRSCCRSGGTLA